MKVIAIFSQEKDTITFDFYDGTAEHYLHFSAAIDCSALYIYRQFTRAKHNVVDLCETLLGDYLQNVNLLEQDRVIVLDFIKHKVVCNIFGSANANLFIIKKDDNKILFALNKANILTGQTYHYEKPNLPQLANYPNDITLLAALGKCDLMLGKYYAKAFVDWQKGMYIDAFKKHLSDYTQQDLVRIYGLAKEFAETLISSDSNYILQNDNEQLLSLIPLADYNIIKKFPSISDAIKYQSIYRSVQQRKLEIRRSVLPKLEREKHRLEKAISIASDLDEPLSRADTYRDYADVLMSQQNVKQRIGENISLTDWNGKQMNIPLDAKLTLLENANRYYTKSRKALEDATIRQKRLPKLQAELTKISHSITEINSLGDDIRKLDKYKNELVKQAVIIMPDVERPMNTKFRTFDLGDGYTLYVGKNAQNNDELTLSFAKPNDVWLHARATTGSHCIVKGGAADGKLPKPILRRAAEIAAYYSDARNAKYTPVVYTQKKYVRKSKGMKAGSVTLQREEMIMVEPQPFDEQH
jgi:predicted ribosome quality control (RQC) complex YloA/Tae2 family protein